MAKVDLSLYSNFFLYNYLFDFFDQGVKQENFFRKRNDQ